MRKGTLLGVFLIPVLSVLFLFAGCAKKEVVPETKCSKVVGLKYYQDNFFRAVVKEYYVLEDDRTVFNVFVFGQPLGKYDLGKEVCTTEYKPKK